MKTHSKTVYRLLGIGLISSLSACSIDTMDCTKIAQSEIYQSYTVSYDATDNETEALASFRAGGATGTTLNLDGQCDIVHDSISMSKDSFNWLGTYYSGERNGLVSSGTFTFTNNDGETFANGITTPPAISLVSPPTTISRSTGATFQFSPAVNSGETVTVYIEYSGPTSGFTSDSTNTVGATQVTLAPSRFANLGNYSVKIYASRSKNKVLDHPSAEEGGNMRAEYKSTKANASLVD